MNTAEDPKTLVLCEPPYVFWDRDMDRLRESEETMPGMGVLMLAAVARSRGYDVRIIDAKAVGTTLDDVVTDVVRARPRYVGFSATTISVTNAGRIAGRLKALMPGVVTILGGAHVSAIPERTLDAFPCIDYGIVGEGEAALFDLIEKLEQGGDVRGVPGLVYREDGYVHANARAAYIENLDALPMPAWDLTPEFPQRFSPSLFGYPRTPVATVITSRGCPYSCLFCDRSTSGRKARFHSVDYVVKMCRTLVSAGVRHIVFVDDLFTIRRKRVAELCTAFLDAEFTFSWSCTSHPNLLDPETLALMKRAGCWQIGYGIESGSQRVLDIVKHEVRIPRMRETLRMTRAAGIRTKGYLMIGHPTEDLESLAETVKLLRHIELDMCQITKFTPYPGSPAYSTIREYGTFVEDWERMNAMNFVFVPHNLNEKILESYFDHMYATFYLRRDVLVNLARLIAQESRFAKRLAASAVVYMRAKFAGGSFVVGRLPRRFRPARVRAKV